MADPVLDSVRLHEHLLDTSTSPSKDVYNPNPTINLTGVESLPGQVPRGKRERVSFYCSDVAPLRRL